jgi:hypothetical protein
MLLLTFLSCCSCLVEIAFASWPLAMESDLGNQVVWLSPDFRIFYTPSRPREVIDLIKYLLMWGICHKSISRQSLT